MSLTVNWNAATGADKYRIYRAKAKFTNATLPTDVTEVANTVLSKTYDDSVRNTTYWFAISSVDSNGVETIGEAFCLGYFPESGPGPKTLLRGDWTFGYFGEVNVTDILSQNQIKAALSEKNVNPNFLNTLFDKYHKFIVNNKVLFIPNNYLTYAGQTTTLAMYAAHGFPATIKDSYRMESNGWQYIYRLPNPSKDPAKYMTAMTIDGNSADWLGSEAGLFAGMWNNQSQNPDWANALNSGGSGTKYHLLDLAYTAYVPVGAQPPVTTSAAWSLQANGSVSQITGSTLRFWPVLELVL